MCFIVSMTFYWIKDIIWMCLKYVFDMESMWINFTHVMECSLSKIIGQAGAASLMAQSKMSGFLKQKAAPMNKEK